MKKNIKSGALIVAGLALTGVMGLTACTTSNADTASRNLATAADNFEIDRRIIFLNVHTGKYEFVVEGKCSITDDGNQLETTCRVGPNEYKKHHQGKAQDFTYFSEQLDTADVSLYHHRVIFKPESIVPDIEFQTGKQ